MKKYDGIIKKSKTMDYAALVIMLGTVEQNLPMVREQLGDYYGWIMIGIGVGIAYFRSITDKSLNEK